MIIFSLGGHTIKYIFMYNHHHMSIASFFHNRTTRVCDIVQKGNEKRSFHHHHYDLQKWHYVCVSDCYLSAFLFFPMSPSAKPTKLFFLCKTIQHNFCHALLVKASQGKGSLCILSKPSSGEYFEHLSSIYYAFGL